MPPGDFFTVTLPWRWSAEPQAWDDLTLGTGPADRAGAWGLVEGTVPAEGADFAWPEDGEGVLNAPSPAGDLAGGACGTGLWSDQYIPTAGPFATDTNYRLGSPGPPMFFTVPGPDFSPYGLLSSEADPIYQIATAMAAHYRRHLDAAVALCARIFPATRVGVIWRNRAKPTADIAKRLVEETRNGYRLQDAQDCITDGIGISIRLHTAGERGVAQFIDALCEAVRDQHIKVLRVSDHHGSNHPGYLAPEAWQQIMGTCQEYQGFQCIRDRARDELRVNGFTTLQVHVEFPGGIIGDIQVRGSMVDWVARTESVIYAIRNDNHPQVDESTAEFGGFKAAYDQLSRGDQYTYDAYLYAWYNWARLMEMGAVSVFPPPTLPERFKELSPLFELPVLHGYVVYHSPKEVCGQACEMAEKMATADEVSTLLAREFAGQQERVVREISAILPVASVGEITYQRAKGAESIGDKLRKYLPGTIPDLATARQTIGDGNAVSITLHTGSSHRVEHLVDHVVLAIETGRLQVLEVINRHGEGVPAYLDEGQAARILAAAKRHQEVQCVRSTGVEISAIGLTLLTLLVRLPDGTRVEVQVKGSMLEWVWKAEHTIYKLLAGGKVDIVPTLEFTGFQRQLADLPAEQVACYKRYIHDYYAFARLTELGYASLPPQLPEGFDHPLFDLHQLHVYTLLHAKSRRR